MVTQLKAPKKVKGKYFEMALCLRDDTAKCGECPYYRMIEGQKQKTIKEEP